MYIKGQLKIVITLAHYSKKFHMSKLLKICFLLCLTSAFANAQVDSLDVKSYNNKQEYEIGGVDVIGAESRDKNAIRSITGLTVGKKIRVPGPQIAQAIKSLWKLRLFDDVKIIETKTLGDVIFLEIQLKERATLSRYSYKGVKKSQHDDLNELLANIITKGSIVTDAQKDLAKKRIKDFYVEKGKLDAVVNVLEYPDTIKSNSVRLVFDVDAKDRVKVENIIFLGNHNLSDRKLRGAMGSTKRKGTLFRRTKFMASEYEEDKRSIIREYNKKGFIDAKIVKDSVWRYNELSDIMIKIWIDEGKRYFFRDITWKGNSKYTPDQLNKILGIAKGDVFNPDLLENRLRFSQDGRDISSLYMDDGYLGLNVEPVMTAVGVDSVDLEIQIAEGPQFTIDKVIIEGNDRTHEHVVRRTVRTKPGQKFSRSDIVRSQREIMNLGYFNPETMNMDTPVNPNRGTVDIKYILEERPSDQLELSAGYGGASGLLGTLGLTFNNFSLANIRDRSSWSPLPQGDGQRLSLRVQSNSRFLNSYNFTFTEPWLGGKQPRSLTVGAVHTSFDFSSLGQGSLKITRGSVGLGTRLKWPDDFFSSNTTLTLESIRLSNYSRGQFFVDLEDEIINVTDGNFKNFHIRQVFTRSSVAEPIYPRRGSRVSLTLQFTPPYSLFREPGFDRIVGQERQDLIDTENRMRGPGAKMTEDQEDAFIIGQEQARKFEFLEYHKWRIDADWYFNIFGKVVLYANAKLGIVGSYDSSLGLSPFERFELGGDGLSNQNVGITGKDIIALRGYEVNELEQNSLGGATVFDKFTMEMRFPLSLNPNSTIYFHTFFQGGNSWRTLRDFNPFDVKRSVGVGMRVFLPMFGLLGFDYGYGIDRNLPDGTPWSNYGKFSIVLGFEPD